MLLLDDETGEPRVFAHDTTDERRGAEMTAAELLQFSVKVLVGIYEQEGMLVSEIDKSLTTERPNFVLESRSGKKYYVLADSSSYPSEIGRLHGADLSVYSQNATSHGALPTIAKAGAYCVDTHGTPPVCGGRFSFKVDPLEAV